MSSSSALLTLRQLISELRNASSQATMKDSLLLQYVLNQYHKFKVTDQQACKAQEEMKYMADAYLCYLRSGRMARQIHNHFHAKGERSVADTAKMVGFKLPHDPK